MTNKFAARLPKTAPSRGLTDAIGQLTKQLDLEHEEIFPIQSKDALTGAKGGKRAVRVQGGRVVELREPKNNNCLIKIDNSRNG
ncbi:hypothetical protein [Variovorax rhizosphaerae]|uniref:Uncharacterized protein n=1 Tax=Variovorax rhizosphaerae TaxID=1836200 RepID=A0ABU8WFE8_9BURK